MASNDKKTQVYADLAELEHKRGALQERDRFLILAADAALTDGRADEAEKFRTRLLEYNPHHLLRPYRSLAEALKSSDVYSYLADLRASYPPEEAEQLLANLTSGKEPGPKSESVLLPLAPPDSSDGPTALGNLRLAREEEPKEEKKTTAPAGPVGPPAEEVNRPPFYPLQREPEPAAVAPARRTAPAARPPRLVAQTREHGEDEDEREEQTAGFGIWIADGLFVLLLAAGLALTVYTLGRPFLALPDSPFK